MSHLMITYINREISSIISRCRSILFEKMNEASSKYNAIYPVLFGGYAMNILTDGEIDTDDMDVMIYHKPHTYAHFKEWQQNYHSQCNNFIIHEIYDALQHTIDMNKYNLCLSKHNKRHVEFKPEIHSIINYVNIGIEYDGIYIGIIDFTCCIKYINYNEYFTGDIIENFICVLHPCDRNLTFDENNGVTHISLIQSLINCNYMLHKYKNTNMHNQRYKFERRYKILKKKLRKHIYSNFKNNNHNHVKHGNFQAEKDYDFIVSVCGMISLMYNTHYAFSQCVGKTGKIISLYEFICYELYRIINHLSTICNAYNIGFINYNHTYYYGGNLRHFADYNNYFVTECEKIKKINANMKEKVEHRNTCY
jgi:hypothetical protein